MRISVVNFTHGLLSNEEVQEAIRAINRQVDEDFSPYWNLTGTLRLEGITGDLPDADNTIDMQGEAIIYLWDESDVPDALGYHDANYRGIPYGFVFIDIATALGEPWTVTFSHEVLELIGDRQANLLVNGPHPEEDRNVYHWREMCDAVQDETYEIDGIEVSNFVLPLYFTPESEEGSRNDFLGRRYRRPSGTSALTSFGVNPGGYVGFYDPIQQDHQTYMGKSRQQSDSELARASMRQAWKNKARQARRGNRYVLDDPDTTKAQTVAPVRRATKIDGTEISIKSKSTLAVRRGVSVLQAKRQRRGYFAYDITADGRTVAEELEESDFEEIEALEIERPDSADEAGELELVVKHEPDEFLCTLVEIDGVIFWQQGKTDKKKQSSRFDIRLEPNETVPGRRGFLKKIAKTIIRVIRHKASDAIKEEVKERLDDYLAEKVEKLAFKKSVPAVMHEFKLLKNPINKKIGDIVTLKGSIKANKRYLLLIHGIFSSSKGAFDELLLSRSDDQLLRQLKGSYEKVISFDHWTVAKSTLDNAHDLINMLTAGSEIDIICHSRGAGVTRCLLEHPEVSPKLNEKNIRVGKVVFVAGACQGSPLALPSRIATLVNVFSALSSATGAFFPLKLITAIAKAAQYGVNNFPGISAMSPKSPILKALNQPINYEDCEYIYMRSNYEPKGRLTRLLDEIGLDRFGFRGQRNDGVVPFSGAGTFDDHVEESIPVTEGPEFGIKRNEAVFHTRFFKQRAVRDALLAHLASQ